MYQNCDYVKAYAQGLVDFCWKFSRIRNNKNFVFIKKSMTTALWFSKSWGDTYIFDLIKQNEVLKWFYLKLNFSLKIMTHTEKGLVIKIFCGGAWSPAFTETPWSFSLLSWLTPLRDWLYLFIIIHLGLIWKGVGKHNLFG